MRRQGRHYGRYERGNMDNKFYEISEDEANQIVERIRRTVTGKG
jgi:hypothetical protein